MGLFSKKKEANKMSSSFSSLASTNMPVPPPPSHHQGFQDDDHRARELFSNQGSNVPNQMNFNTGLQNSFSQSRINDSMQRNEYENDSVFMQGVKITSQPVNNQNQENEDFHLPDFDEAELAELSKISSQNPVVDKNQNQNQNQNQIIITPPTQATQPNSTEFLITKKEEIAILPPERRIQVTQMNEGSVSSIMVGESGKKTNSVDKFLDMKTFFTIKEKIFESKTIARASEDAMANQHYNMRAEDYDSLARTLNEVQQKLMLIENKLFYTNNPEVN